VPPTSLEAEGDQTPANPCRNVDRPIADRGIGSGRLPDQDRLFVGSRPVLSPTSAGKLAYLGERSRY
jgi:hypothetical protein